MSTTTVPVDLDAVEERVAPQLSLGQLVAVAASLAIAALAFRALAGAPLPLRTAAAALAAAAAWIVPTASVCGATPATWALRLGAYALSRHRIVPASRVWRRVVA